MLRVCKLVLLPGLSARLFAQYPCSGLEDVIRVSELGAMQMTLGVSELPLIKLIVFNLKLIKLTTLSCINCCVISHNTVRLTLQRNIEQE